MIKGQCCQLTVWLKYFSKFYAVQVYRSYGKYWRFFLKRAKYLKLATLNVKEKCLQHYKEAPNLIFFVAFTGAFSSWVKWKWVHCATHKLRIWSTKWSIHWKKESHFGKIHFLYLLQTCLCTWILNYLGSLIFES